MPPTITRDGGFGMDLSPVLYVAGLCGAPSVQPCAISPFAVERDPVRRISDQQQGFRVAYKFLNHFRRGAVAADQAMVTQQPHFAGLRGGIEGNLRNRIFICETVSSTLQGEQQSKFVIFETDGVDIVFGVLQSLDFQAKHFVVPTAVERELVVGKHESATSVFRQSIDYDDGDFSQPEFPRSRESRMASDDDAIGSGEDRLEEAELFDRSCACGRCARTGSVCRGATVRWSLPLA